MGTDENDHLLRPEGELSLQLPAGHDAVNMFGDVYGGWVSSQAVLASEIRAGQEAQGRIATVSVGRMTFMSPVLQGTILSFYTRVLERGHSSLRIEVECWGLCPDGKVPRKVTACECVQVAIDADGHIRRLPPGEE
ncbi:acyl-CoA thioesterase [Marinobacterium mangrovicola]|uniref:Acyl-CoA thioesterase YciA n=1 Tax=Marinobacterium mangrovicola TaxID=1476959 RepID=A0A4R1GCR4_9GAMM|nr:hotdog domain-containing protein [Marinobacterium mangrovicola]TCK03499.1 acyl-CoA thioesterase YciA [Marinobacterium mangrovicola]